MKDQLAFYQLDDRLFDQAEGMDFVEGSEVAAFLERRGRIVTELLLERAPSAGELLEGLSGLLGGAFRPLIGRGGESLGPPGPHTFCTVISDGDLSAMRKALAKARQALGRDRDHDPQTADLADRLAQLTTKLKLTGSLGPVLRDLDEFLEHARAAQGVLIAVYSR
jgi:hypothetical protein